VALSCAVHPPKRIEAPDIPAEIKQLMGAKKKGWNG